LLCELGRSAALIGDPRALEWLEGAIDAGGGSPAGIEAAIWFCSAVAFAGGADEAMIMGGRVLEQSDPGDELRQRLESTLLGLGQISPTVRHPVRELVRRNLDAAFAGEELPAGFLANAAIECALTADAERAAVLAARAVEQGVVNDVGHDEPGPSFTVGALVATERFDEAERLAAEMLATARSRGTIRYYAAGLALRAWSRYRQGRLDDVRADAELYPEFSKAPVTDAMLAGPHMQALIDAGELDRAVAIANGIMTVQLDPGLTAYQRFHEGLAALRLAQGDPRGALEVTRRVAAWEQGIEQRNGAWVPWRSQAALAHAALGERDRAASLAREQVELARSFGTPGMLGSALRVLGLVHGSREGVAVLREATETLERGACRLEHGRALIDLGAALRRAGQQAEARERLREGLDIAHRCGATALADDARDELVAAGARPRRSAVRDVDALTPSERRVAAMASEGMSNKEIAQALFVTVNTVETHLRHAYRKLDINSRAQLAGRLGGVALAVMETAQRLWTELAAPVA
jgi:DNA-binding CsgD family transcriptional regulator